MTRWRKAAAVTLSVVTGVAVAVPPAVAGDGGQEVKVRDECDQATFDAALFPGACDSRYGGDVTFAELMAELTSRPGDVLRKRDALGWKFGPDSTETRAGGSIVFESLGGEMHTITKVARFGGGCVEEVNHAMGLAEHEICDDDKDGDQVPDWTSTFIAPGQTVKVEHVHKGTHHYECLIHPWMRTTVVAR